jgi:hypothetical protein
MSKNREALMHISSRVDGITRSINAVVYGVLAEIIMRVDARSPVGDAAYWKRPPPKGYQGGQFRGNWQLTIDGPAITPLYGNIDPSGVDTVGKNIAAIPDRPAYGKQYYLVNALPYAKAIENGWSKQAPRGVISLTKLEFKQIVQEVSADIKSKGGRVR